MRTLVAIKTIPSKMFFLHAKKFTKGAGINSDIILWPDGKSYGAHIINGIP
jgi:hypothetical protein